MKTMLAVLSILLLAGCASAPRMPSSAYMLQEIHAGRMKADDVNKIYDDYRVARAEYEESASYKATLGAVMVGMVVVGAAAGSLSSGYRSSNYTLPNKVIVNSIPTGGGGYMTTIKGYK